MTRLPKILVVDDQPVNILLVRKKLEQQGMEVIAARSGRECLDLVAAEKPDLILLDVMMPEMDGVEVCAELKRQEATRSIPVIFLTAKDSKAGKLEGLSAGAVDYITKPIDLDETVARVRSQLRFYEIFKENLELTERLGEARRAATLGALSQGIAHNLNNLLGVIYGFLELAKMNVGRPDTAKRHLDKIDEAVVRMTRIIRQVTNVSTRTRIKLSPTPAARLVEGGIARFRLDHNLATPVEVIDQAPEAVALANVEVFEDALSKLLINAWESYGASPPAEPQILVTVAHKRLNGRAILEFAVHDRGIGLDPAVRDSVFEPFVSTKSTVGVGMGLTIARHGIRNLGGDIALVPRPGGGTSAVFHLAPAVDAAATAA